jgi:hypothetical protein
MAAPESQPQPVPSQEPAPAEPADRLREMTERLDRLREEFEQLNQRPVRD